MSNKMYDVLEPELQLIIIHSEAETTETTEKPFVPFTMIIAEYKKLDKKCDEVLKKIYNRKSKKN